MPLTSDEKNELLKTIEGNTNPKFISAIKKLSQQKLKYYRGNKNVKIILMAAFRKKLNVKIQYYSLSSDETRFRKLSIYQLGDRFIIAYCHLRKEERTFVIDRINSIAMLDEKYTVPKNWKPKSNVF